MNTRDFDVAVIGTGIVGLATAYYLKQHKPQAKVALIDAAEPMSYTSAQSGENYRNWWPHPVMTSFTNQSIDLLEEIALSIKNDTTNNINMTRRGYLLCTRAADISDLFNELTYGYSQSFDSGSFDSGSSIRVHDQLRRDSYQAPLQADWQCAPDGVDILQGDALVKKHFPTLSNEITALVHIRRAGSVDSHSLGQYMLQSFRYADGIHMRREVESIAHHESGFRIHTTGDDADPVNAQQIVNAAGPAINQIAEMLGEQLPVYNILQQKIAFEDIHQTIPRTLPFCIDLDAQRIDWTEEERQELIESDEHQWLTETMPGAIHCRPEGGDNGKWLKLGWAFNSTASQAVHTPELMASFPEIVIRGAARLHPTLKKYYGSLPRAHRHYGGYYTMTDENWPLIGAMQTSGAYVVGAMSGFGTMAACAAGELCAKTVLNQSLPDYADSLSPQRYRNPALMREIDALSQKGIL